MQMGLLSFIPVLALSVGVAQFCVNLTSSDDSFRLPFIVISIRNKVEHILFFLQTHGAVHSNIAHIILNECKHYFVYSWTSVCRELKSHFLGP